MQVSFNGAYSRNKRSHSFRRQTRGRFRKPLRGLGIESLESRELLAGDTTVMFNDHVRGGATHPNTTSYAANSVSSGFMKDIDTGQETGITLDVSTVGAKYELITLPPNEGTDAHNIFDGFVFMSVGSNAGIKLGDGATYTHTFSGLNPNATYDFVGTAVRGDSNSPDKWTLVTLDSAESQTNSHSESVGVVTADLPANEVALWTGNNRGEGAVIGWSNIRPGADGTFSVISSQYKGSTPDVGTGDSSGGSHGFGLEAIRLIENQPTLKVISSSITEDERLADPPSAITFDFSSDIDAATIAASDLLIDGNAATDVTIVDSDTLTWTLPTLSAGNHTLSFSEGVMLNTPLAIPNQPFELTFAVLGAPTVQNIAASNVTPIDAIVGSTVINAGGDAPQVFVYWGDNDGGTNSEAWDNVISLGATPDGETRTRLIESLTQSTTYFYRTFAENLAGSDWADATSSFATPAAMLPIVASLPAESIAARSARLNGFVSETGGDPPTITLYYGDNDGGTTAGNWDASISLGKRDGEFSHFVRDLTAESTYYYRIFAENMAGSRWAPTSISFTTTENIPATVVINELMIDPADSTEFVEFIELHNPSDFLADLSEWNLEDAVNYKFPSGTTLEPGAFLVIAQDADAFESKFGRTADGVWQDGDRLNNDGENVVLRNAAGDRVDRVGYQLGFPWPTTGFAGRSIELVNPLSDNDIGGNWRGAAGASNLPDQPVRLLPAADGDWLYRKGTSEASSPDDAWRAENFATDATWLAGQTPLGYGDNDDNTVLSDMRGSYSSVYLRNSFTLTELPPALTVRVYADDGGIVWINGQEVARVSVSPGDKAFDDFAVNHEAVWEEIVVSDLSMLKVGKNTVAVHGLNTTLSSSDMSIDVEVLIPAADPNSGTPTPGAQNSVFAENVAPQMRQVDHSPNQPTSGEEVVVTVKVTDPEGVDSVTLDYQVVEPGSYIKLDDPAYQTTWTTVTMSDDGTGGDEKSGDDVYTVTLPAELQTHRRLIRYRITATDQLSASVTGPYADDPQPNFAYFVYDGVPDYEASLRPGNQPVQTFSADALNRVPAYQLIANATDVQNSQYVSSFDGVQFYATMVYDGQVYDHIEYRNRGAASTYQVGKNKWKLNFTRGHAFEARDNFGDKYDVPWDRMNILPNTNPWWRNDISTDGTALFEPTGFRLFELAGTPSSHTQYFQFRIIDGVDEVGQTQYDGDFWGLYTAIEQPDDRFLKERGLSDGNIYNLHGGVGGSTTQRAQGSLLPTDRSDLASFISSSTGYDNASRTEQWWRENVNLDAYYGWYAMNLVVNNSDLRPEENVNYYHNQENGQWYTLPWDLDLIFEDRPHLAGSRGPTPNEDFKKVFDRIPAIKLDFDNYARGLRDLLLDNGEAAELIGELATILTDGETSGTIVQADQAQWDYHPQKRKKGIWYANFNPQLMPERTFESYTQYMQDFVSPGGYGHDQLIVKVNDAGVPDRPSITYVGPDGFPKSQLSFMTTPFSDSQDNGTFAGMQWRVAEVHNPSVSNYDPNDRNIFEIEGTWESDVITQFDARLDVPSEVVEVGKTYRTRIRMQDSDGKWSHWSEPIEFLATTAPTSATAEFLRISEVSYNPAGNGAREFIELTNISTSVDLDITGVTLSDGPGSPFIFPAGSSLAPGEYLVVVRDMTEFQTAYPAVAASQIAGDYAGSLSNSGERIRLEDAGGNVIVDIDYEDRGLWSEWADGLGGTLVAKNVTAPQVEFGDPRNWRGSTEIGGSPAAANQPALGVVVSEILAHTDAPQQDAIELTNQTDVAIDLSGWFLSDAGSRPLKFEIPTGTTLAAGQVIVFTEADFNPTPLTPDENDFGLDGSGGDDLWLFAPNGAGGVGQYADDVHFGATLNGQTLGITSQSNGHLVPMARNGLGCTGGSPAVSDFFISTINYAPAAPSEAALAIDPDLDGNDLEYLIINGPGSGGSLNGWRIRGGVDVDLTETASVGSWVVSFDPTAPENTNKLAAFRAQYGLTSSTNLVGGYSGSLSNSGERLRLQRPDTPPLDNPAVTPFITMDEVNYKVHGDWPAITPGDPIVRLGSTFFGSDGSLWSHRSTRNDRTFDRMDFNGDGSVDGTDLDQIIDAVARKSENVAYKLSGTIPVAIQPDVDVYLRDALGSLNGDANLDGVVNAADLNQLGLNWQQRACSGWQDGDFNSDSIVNAADLNEVGLNWQQSAVENAVPRIPTSRVPRAPLAAAADTAVRRGREFHQVGGIAKQPASDAPSAAEGRLGEKHTSANASIGRRLQSTGQPQHESQQALRERLLSIDQLFATLRGLT